MEDIDTVVESTLPIGHQRQLLQLINEYRNCFARQTAKLGKAKSGALEIRLKDEDPVTYRPYRLSYAE